MSVSMSISTPYLMSFPYVYDGSAQPLMSESDSYESVLPPAYAVSQASAFEHSSPRPASSPIDLAALYDDDAPDPILPPNDAYSFVPSGSDSDSDSDSDPGSDVTLHDEPLPEVCPTLQLCPTEVVDSTLSPVDPAFLGSLDIDLVASPLDAWADVCYADSVLEDNASEDDETGSGKDSPHYQRPESRHAFASRVHSPHTGHSVIEHVPLPCTLGSTAPNTTVKPMSPPPLPSTPSSPPLSYSPSLSRSTPTLASPRARRAPFSLDTIRSQSPLTPESEDDGAHADDEGDGGYGRANDPHLGLRGWTPPRVWTGYEMWVPVADVEEKVTALHLDLGAQRRADGREKGDLEQAALPQRVQFNMRPTSPVPGYPLLFSREPPNPADSVHFFPKRCRDEEGEDENRCACPSFTTSHSNPLKRQDFTIHDSSPTMTLSTCALVQTLGRLATSCSPPLEDVQRAVLHADFVTLLVVTIAQLLRPSSISYSLHISASPIHLHHDQYTFSPASISLGHL
ncbi:uncharacterized protein B0H18DRAFT_97118 [Fomitopsis serialis]|uniref:uncharacterized protein n=1 Tax=Fomitopsis serialis TaxID=139415 RepID=UPI0020084040|nr:uncharacterized protein B0H18DRAFT_97118 [Neoantrodia serialis]KAH9915404.1 hypothetical protein B0H18DRAFT_97118 [Neoantrodia serialis]